MFSFLKINAAKRQQFSSKEDERKHLYLSIFMPLVFVLIMWIVKICEVVFEQSLSKHGILPRTLSGLQGVLFSPFLHGDWNHLISNSIPFMILGFLMIYTYRKVAAKSFLFIWIASGFMVWLTGRESYHIGASNLVYGFASFIFFSGVFRRDIQSIVLSLFVVFVYGSIVWGIFPIKPDISWEGHLMGAVSGAFIAFFYRKVDLPEPIKLDDEEDEDELDVIEEKTLPPETQLGKMLDDLSIKYEIIEKQKK